ncbi:type II secretion system F family protein [Candidatus Woesearchaeota archaeon]|nr:type II secretion system F family protein [Candidatus Woesearchaeota archaeon]
MAQLNEEELKGMMKKYEEALNKEFSGQKSGNPEEDTPIKSSDYLEFKHENMPRHMNYYEKACNFCERILKVKPSKKAQAELDESIPIAHLEVTPTGVQSFAVLGPLLFMIIGFLVSMPLPMLLGGKPQLFFMLCFFVVGMILMMTLTKLPSYFANQWRLKASNQMVLCIFYVVTYMRHTSNLENAIRFAADHLSPPLSFDLKKVLWDAETEKYATVKESMDNYLQTWRKWNLEFVESFHLIESSLYESSESRRLSLLDKSLSVILEETYEKMLHYAHNLKSPIEMLHMLGIILPILGLVILPLLVSFIGSVRWYHIAFLYNILLPLGVAILGKQILSSRPTGYGDSDVSKYNPALAKFKNVNFTLFSKEYSVHPLWIATGIAFVLLFIGLLPIIFYNLNCNTDFVITQDWMPQTIHSDTPECDGLTDATAKFHFLFYRPAKNPEYNGDILGPYGLGASILSVFFVLGIGIWVGVYYYLRSKNLIAIRNQTKELENEFASGLFQLGNRLGDGIPAEIAFEKVAEVMKDTKTGKFFEIISKNISNLGMSVEEAIFNPKVGALASYPSNVIESSMKVLVESSRKGPTIAAQSLMNISRYIKEIHRVNERLRDLMSDIISSMKSQISFLTPAIAGIVIGITSMVTEIINKLGFAAEGIAGGSDVSQVSGGTLLQTMFGDGVPTYYFQIVVGIYVVQITYILTVLANGVENGSDTLQERYTLGKNMLRSPVLYGIISIVIMLIFNLIAAQILGSGVMG